MTLFMKKPEDLSGKISDITVAENINDSRDNKVGALLKAFNSTNDSETFKLLESLCDFSSEKEAIDIRNIDLKIQVSNSAYRRQIKIWSNGVYSTEQANSAQMFTEFIAPILEDYWND